MIYNVEQCSMNTLALFVYIAHCSALELHRRLWLRACLNTSPNFSLSKNQQQCDQSLFRWSSQYAYPKRLEQKSELPGANCCTKSQSSRRFGHRPANKKSRLVIVLSSLSRCHISNAILFLFRRFVEVSLLDLLSMIEFVQLFAKSKLIIWQI